MTNPPQRRSWISGICLRAASPAVAGVFELVVVVCATQTARAQTFTLLYSFAGGPTDGASPSAGLVRDAEGNFYGTTVVGGAHNDGVVFKVEPTGKETVLCSFKGYPADGEGP
jgi:uncharacterized repeat protein (TIGR03803 family)